MNAKDKRTYLKGVELQHRHYSFIAGVLRTMDSDKISAEAREYVIGHFVAELRGTNARFNASRFLAAAKGE